MQRLAAAVFVPELVDVMYRLGGWRWRDMCAMRLVCKATARSVYPLERSKQRLVQQRYTRARRVLVDKTSKANRVPSIYTFERRAQKLYRASLPTIQDVARAYEDFHGHVACTPKGVIWTLRRLYCIPLHGPKHTIDFRADSIVIVMPPFDEWEGGWTNSCSRHSMMLHLTLDRDCTVLRIRGRQTTLFSDGKRSHECYMLYYPISYFWWAFWAPLRILCFACELLHIDMWASDVIHLSSAFFASHSEVPNVKRNLLEHVYRAIHGIDWSTANALKK